MARLKRSRARSCPLSQWTNYPSGSALSAFPVSSQSSRPCRPMQLGHCHQVQGLIRRQDPSPVSHSWLTGHGEEHRNQDSKHYGGRGSSSPNLSHPNFSSPIPRAQDGFCFGPGYRAPNPNPNPPSIPHEIVLERVTRPRPCFHPQPCCTAAASQGPSFKPNPNRSPSQPGGTLSRHSNNNSCYQHHHHRQPPSIFFSANGVLPPLVPLRHLQMGRPLPLPARHALDCCGFG